MTRGPRTLILTGTWDGGTLWRAAFPALACRNGGEAVTLAGWNTPAMRAELPHAEVVSLTQLTFPSEREGLAFLDVCHRRGQTVMWDCADDLLSDALLPHLQATHPDQPEAEQVAWQAQCRWMAAHVDGLTVPNAVVAERARAWTAAPIAVVPNRLAWDWWRREHRQTDGPHAGVTVGWVGADRGAADTAPMLAAWGRLARRFPTVRFVVAGWCLPGIREAIFAARRTVRPWVDPGHSPRQWAGIDIACLPLADTPFNAAKSALKALEAGAAGCAIVASPLIYGDVLTDGRTALFAETVDDWERALARLIQGPKLRQTLARRWAARVEAQYTLEAGEWQCWPAAWRKLRAVHRGREAA
jgi:glycosyltransferase involved in cell wall biosynthesis